jgi:phosphoglycolate phosphatase
MPAMIQAVLFDLDGTLADTAPDMARTLNLMRERRGLDPVALELVRPHVSRGARGMICSGFGITTEHPEFKAMRDEFLALYGENLFVDSKLFPGMDALLEGLEVDGIAWGVVTNKFERFARPLMDAFGLASRIAVLVGGDTCPRPKPFPDPLLFAAAKLRIAPMRILYVGDDERDVQAARAAGMPVLVAGYGYLGDAAPAALWGADAVVQSAPEIGAWLRGRSGARAGHPT